MYGLVNQAMSEMVTRDHGAAVWERIKQESDVDIDVFVANASYPDDTTYRLVGAASKVLELPAEDVLRAFGEFWVLHTALRSYGPLMRAVGRDVPEFLQKLPHLHARVQMIFPELRPPEFECTDVQAESLLLHYRTQRPTGLEPFVEGLVHGIGRMFDTPVSVRVHQHRGEGAAHSVFHVGWGAR
jgi:hypothetical protein